MLTEYRKSDFYQCWGAARRGLLARRKSLRFNKISYRNLRKCPGKSTLWTRNGKAAKALGRYGFLT